MSDALQTIALPWAVVTVVMTGSTMTWAELVVVSATWLGASTVASWHASRRRSTQLARGQAALHRVQQREAEARHASSTLHAQLVQLTREVTEPQIDDRRQRLKELGVTVELGIGDRRVPVRLRDLTLTEVFLEVPRSEAVTWRPGLPVRVSAKVDGSCTILGWASADHALQLPADAPPVWRLRWREPLRQHELPRALWRAIMNREAHRIAPHPDTRAWLHLDDGPHMVLVTDLSATGLGLTMPLGLRDAGRLPQRLRLALQLPEHDDPVELTCELVHMDVRTSGTALGLRLDPDDPRYTETQPRLASHVMRREARSRVRLVS